MAVAKRLFGSFRNVAGGRADPESLAYGTEMEPERQLRISEEGGSDAGDLPG
jgi:hypothetical protein